MEPLHPWPKRGDFDQAPEAPAPARRGLWGRVFGGSHYLSLEEAAQYWIYEAKRLHGEWSSAAGPLDEAKKNIRMQEYLHRKERERARNLEALIENAPAILAMLNTKPEETSR